MGARELYRSDDLRLRMGLGEIAGWATYAERSEGSQRHVFANAHGSKASIYALTSYGASVWGLCYCICDVVQR